MECLIVGGGAAGLHAAISCRQCWPEKSITLIDAEKEIGYYRSLIPQFMVNQSDETNLFFWRQKDDPLFEVRSGTKVQFLDRKNQLLHLSGKEKIAYDRLILAPGGHPLMPLPLDGHSCRGIFPIRNLTSARKIRKWLSRHHEIVVLGGGLVGVKTAVHLSLSGRKVSLVEKEPHLLPRALTAGTAKLVEDHLRQMGVNLLLGSDLGDFRMEKGRLKAVKVNNQWLPADTLLIAIGSIPQVGFLEGSGLLENGDLVVSQSLQTRDKKIFAAGDAVTILDSEETKIRPWTWPQAISQGRLAAANLYRSAPFPLNDLTHPNAMNLHDLNLVILGGPVPDAEVVCYIDQAKGIRHEYFLLNGVIAGGALVGEISAAGPLHAMMATKRKFDRGSDIFLMKGTDLPISAKLF